MKEVARALLRIRAVTLSPDQPYTWASGIQSPIYCDNRLLLSYPEERRLVEEALASLVSREFPGAQTLMGTATAGIPHAAIAAWKLDLPMGFVRAKAKDHGKNNAIEGRCEPGTKVVVVEDLVSTGGSSLAVVDTLREAGADVLGMVAIFTYGMKKAVDAMAESKVRLFTLTNWEELSEVALEEGYIRPEHLRKLKAFQQNPQDPAWRDA